MKTLYRWLSCDYKLVGGIGSRSISRNQVLNMRQIGKLPTKQQAYRFSDFLITQGIDAVADEDDGEWVIWVRNEDQLPEAREHLTNFAADPTAAKYVAAGSQADRVRKEQEAQHRVRAKQQH